VLSRWRSAQLSIRRLAEKHGIDIDIRHRFGNGGRKSTILPDVERGILEWSNIEREILKDGMTINRGVVNTTTPTFVQENKSSKLLSSLMEGVPPL
jgi:hypothetical protein